MTAIMTEHHLDLQNALHWLGTYTDGVISRFLSHVKRIPSWGPAIDRRVQVYIDGLGTWVRGNDDWSYETKRYHGDAGPKIREDRILRLSQRSNVPLLNLREKETNLNSPQYQDDFPGLDSPPDHNGEERLAPKFSDKFTPKGPREGKGSDSKAL